MNKNQVLATLATIDYTCFGIKSLELFGSLARDEARVTSDVDILVEFEETPTFDHYMGLKFYLEDLLGTRWIW
jgi:predicted nucleotidyltransferase